MRQCKLVITVHEQWTGSHSIPGLHLISYLERARKWMQDCLAIYQRCDRGAGHINHLASRPRCLLDHVICLSARPPEEGDRHVWSDPRMYSPCILRDADLFGGLIRPVPKTKTMASVCWK